MGMVFSGLYIFLFISIWWLISNLCSLLNCFLSLSCVNVCSSVSVRVSTFCPCHV